MGARSSIFSKPQSHRPHTTNTTTNKTTDTATNMTDTTTTRTRFQGHVAAVAVRAIPQAQNIGPFDVNLNLESMLTG